MAPIGQRYRSIPSYRPGYTNAEGLLLIRLCAGAGAVACQNTRERRRIHGLREMRIEAGLLRALLVSRLPPASDGDHDDMLLRWLTAYLPAGFVPVDARHPDIHEHKVGIEFPDSLESALGIMSHPRSSTKLFDQHRHRVGGVAVVVDDDDPACNTRHVVLQWRRRWRSVVGRRHGNEKGTSPPGAVAARDDLATMHLDQASGQRETDAEPPMGTFRCRFRLREKLEYPRQQVA